MQTSDWNRNEVIFKGRLGGDPEMSYTTKGKPVTKFSLAVNQGKDKDAMWLNIVCWEALAEQVNTDAAKGDLVEVHGRLTQRKYQGKYYHDVVATSAEVEQKNTKSSKSESMNESDGLGDLDDHPF